MALTAYGSFILVRFFRKTVPDSETDDDLGRNDEVLQTPKMSVKKGPPVTPTSEKYIRMRQAYAEIKYKLALTEKREQEAKDELAKMMLERHEMMKKQKKPVEADVNAIVKKHCGKKTTSDAKKPAKKITRTKKTKSKKKAQSDSDSDSSQTSTDAKKPAKKITSTKKNKSNKKSQSDSDSDSSLSGTDEGVEDDELSEKVPLGQPTSDGDDEEDDEESVARSPQAQQLVVEEDAKEDMEENAEQKPSEDDVDPCGGHKSFFDWKQMDNPKYMNPGQKFADVICLQCGEKPKIALNKPIVYCPYFDQHCDAVLCNGCYTTLLCNSKIDRTSTRRAQKQN